MKKTLWENGGVLKKKRCPNLKERKNLCRGAREAKAESVEKIPGQVEASFQIFLTLGSRKQSNTKKENLWHVYLNLKKIMALYKPYQKTQNKLHHNQKKGIGL